MELNQFLEKYQKVPVEHYPNKVHNKPTLSVCVQTYQHAPFIKQCLDSILMQQTNFDLEILLGDDASTDGTREICIEYADKYPDKIRLFLHHRENNIKINGSPTGRFNFLWNLYNSRGKYISFIEGDDFWLSKYKLQKQVDFFNHNPDYSLVSCFSTNYNENGKAIGKSYSGSVREIDITYKDILRGYRPQMRTNALMFKADVKNKIDKWILLGYSGNLFVSTLAMVGDGKCKVLPFVGAAYRKHSEGIWTSLNYNSWRKIAHDNFVIIHDNIIIKKRNKLKYKVTYLRNHFLNDFSKLNFKYILDTIFL